MTPLMTLWEKAAADLHVTPANYDACLLLWLTGAGAALLSLTIDSSHKKLLRNMEATLREIADAMEAPKQRLARTIQ